MGTVRPFSSATIVSSDKVEAHQVRLVGEELLADEEKDTTCCYARQDKFWVT